MNRDGHLRCILRPLVQTFEDCLHLAQNLSKVLVLSQEGLVKAQKLRVKTDRICWYNRKGVSA